MVKYHQIPCLQKETTGNSRSGGNEEDEELDGRMSGMIEMIRLSEWIAKDSSPEKIRGQEMRGIT